MNLKDEMCQLPVYEREDVLSMQQVKQELGWQITAFHLPKAWAFSRGEGVKVAVLDTGADLNHPDLSFNLLPGYNFVNPGTPPEDDNCHGSHVAGIICASDNAEGVVGVAPLAKVMPVKVLNRSGNGNMLNVVKGLHWAIENGADIITMSLGTRSPIDEVQEAIRKAAAAGIVTFCAAGNAGSTKQLLYPAAYPDCISIGAVDENSLRADFSCTGPNLDFVAPGVKIMSTVPPSWYSFLSGTSMAAPFAVGVAALILSYKRKQSPGIKMTADDYRQILRQNTLEVKNLDQALDAAGRRFFQGFGIINPECFEQWVELKKAAEIKDTMEILKEKIEMLKDPAFLGEIKDKIAEVAAKLVEKANGHFSQPSSP